MLVRLAKPERQDAWRLSRPMLLFGLIALLPGALVVGIGWRALAAEEQSAVRQFRDRLDTIADRVIVDLAKDLRLWESDAGQVVADNPADTAPALAQRMIAVGAVSVVLDGDGRVTATPATALLWKLDDPDAGAAAPATGGLAFSERLEYAGDLIGASEAYDRLLKAASRPDRPRILLRLGATLKKAGRLDRALDVFTELSAFDRALVGSLPADLAARSEICAIHVASGRSVQARTCALAAYTDLVNGRWPLTRSWYEAYASLLSTVLQDTGVDAPALDALRRAEQRKRALSLAATDARDRARISGPANQINRALLGPGAGFVAFWQSPHQHAAGFAVVIPVAAFLRNEGAPGITRMAGDERVNLALVNNTGRTLASSGEGLADAAARGVIGRSSHRDDELAWSAAVWPRDPGQLAADLVRRRRLYFSMIAVVMASLVIGGALTARTVARDLEVARLKAEFVSAVSHDFRTPLAGIRQYTEMLASGRVAGDEKRQRYLQLILGAAERLGRLVDNVLDAARIEAGRQAYDPSPLDPTSWLRCVAAEFEATQPPERRLVATIAEGLPALIADGQALGRAVHNLLDNAVKYSPGESAVWLDAVVDQAHLIIRVRDRGVGIPDSEQSRLFERFFRGSALSHTVGGAGLGLSLVRHVVESHGGSVTCESAPGKGSLFTIRLSFARRGSDGTLGTGAPS